MKKFFESKNLRMGGYSALLSVIVLAILVAVNVFVAELPATMTQYDISASRLYSVTSDTKAVVNNLQDDVNIYWIVQAGKEDGVLEKMLNVYDGMSDHIHVEKKDPDVYPTFAGQYTDEAVSNNSLIVAAKDKSRYISYDNIYEQQMSDDMSDTSEAVSFDGESEITSSISYVVSTEMPQIYVLEGHGEQELSSGFKDEIEKANMETQTLSLLKVDSIPDDAAMILIQAPASDISDKEAEMLRKYVEDGGKLMVFSGPQKTELTNLKSLIEDYGVHTEDGIVIEGSRDGYAFSAPYILLPTLGNSEIVQPLKDEHRNVIIPLAEGLTIDNSDKAGVFSLADTTDQSFSKLDGFSLKDYNKGDNDPEGPFSVAVSIKRRDNDGKIIWVASDFIMDDTYDAYASGGNTDFVMNAMSWEIGNSNPITIRSKSLNADYLTISDSAASRIKLVMIVIVPLVYLFFGLDEAFRRRKLR